MAQPPTSYVFVDDHWGYLHDFGESPHMKIHIFCERVVYQEKLFYNSVVYLWYVNIFYKTSRTYRLIIIYLNLVRSIHGYIYIVYSYSFCLYSICIFELMLWLNLPHLPIIHLDYGILNKPIHIPWRIHGAGIYANMNGVYWWDPWSTIYSSTMDPMGYG
jgi:hypothetical protein